MTVLIATYLAVACMMLAAGLPNYFAPDTVTQKRIAANLLLTFAIWPVWLLVLLWLILKQLWKLVVRGLPQLWRDARG